VRDAGAAMLAVASAVQRPGRIREAAMDFLKAAGLRHPASGDWRNVVEPRKGGALSPDPGSADGEVKRR